MTIFHREGEFSLPNQLVSGVVERCGRYLMYGEYILYRFQVTGMIEWGQFKTKKNML